MALENAERRSHPRIEIDGCISYRTPGSDKVGEGLLENLSEGGARIWLDEELPAESQLTIRMESDSQGEAGMTFKATLLYALPLQEVFRYGYGCSIEASVDWPVEREQARLQLVTDDA